MVQEIPVLLYHNIGRYPAIMMEDGMLPETFEKQMKYLSDNNYRVVTLAKVLDHINGKIKLPQNTLAITIDGGYEDAFTSVLPVLKKYNFPAAFFIPPGYIGNERMIKGQPIKCMTWKQVNEINKNGMGIGLLAHNGQSIRMHYNEKEIKEGVAPDMKTMSENLEIPLKYCAFKEGVIKKPLWKFLQNKGFEAVFTQCPTNRRTGFDAIGRIQIDDDDHNIFLTKISRTYLFFKDKRSWKYIRKYGLDKVVHRLSETLEEMRGISQ